MLTKQLVLKKKLALTQDFKSGFKKRDERNPKNLELCQEHKHSSYGIHNNNNNDLSTFFYKDPKELINVFYSELYIQLQLYRMW